MPSRTSLIIALLLMLGVGGGWPSSAAASAATPTAGSPVASPMTSVPHLPVTVTDKDGQQITVTDVSRIIPLNGDVAEIVWALGLGDNVVGTDLSATYPPAAGQRPRIGYQRQLSAEGVLSLNPSVLVGTEAAGPPAVIEQLRAANIPIVILADPPTIDAPMLKIRAVASALGVPEAGERLAAQTQAEIDAARRLANEATTKPTILFLYVRGAGVQMIAGTGTSADAMIAAAGGINAAADAGVTGFVPLTPESLVTAQPDVLLLLEAGLESIGGVDGLVQLPGVAQTPAGAARRVLAFDDLYLLAMGPRTGRALHDLVIGLHPELPAATPVAR